MDLLQLQYFRTIAQYENLTKAAQALFVSQPNLSTSMSRLEDDLGVKLFERRRGKIALTSNGKLFLTYVERMLDELDNGINKVRTAEHAEHNQIRVVSSQFDFISDILRENYPRMRRLGSSRSAAPTWMYLTVCCQMTRILAFILESQSHRCWNIRRCLPANVSRWSIEIIRWRSRPASRSLSWTGRRLSAITAGMTQSFSR